MVVGMMLLILVIKTNGKRLTRLAAAAAAVGLQRYAWYISLAWGVNGKGGVFYLKL